MAGVAGARVRGVAEVGNRRGQRRFQVENRLAVTIQAGIRGEHRLTGFRRMGAFRHAGVAPDALEAQRQMRAVSEIVRLRGKAESSQKQSRNSTD